MPHVPRVVAFASVLTCSIAATSFASAQAAPPANIPRRDTHAMGDTAHYRVSALVSPYHLGFPLFNVLLEQRLLDHLAIAEELGFGSYASSRVGQLGGRIVYYASGSFDGGLLLGPVVRANTIVYPGRGAVVTPPTEGADATEAFFHDVQVARSNGRDSLFCGAVVGAKGIFGPKSGPAKGLTLLFPLTHATTCGSRIIQLTRVDENERGSRPIDRESPPAGHATPAARRRAPTRLSDRPSPQGPA
jgi:hypothetical protein